MNAPAHPSHTPLAPDTAPAKARKTPTDFNAEADAFNAGLDATLRDLAHAQNEVARCMTEREILVGRAKEFGVTGSYARTLLRKA